jgi:imidazole glycerol phosphate synthase glutamine amidotransferase subunit
LWEPLAGWLAEGRPFLGICVGYQMLFEGSEEAPGAGGFGFFPGMVRRFDAPALKVPQIGWNALEQPDPGHWMWRGLAGRPSFYFVHSYYPDLADPTRATGFAEYGVRFAASAADGRVAGVQFHPEKSQANGLRLLRNFLAESGVSAREETA